MRQTITSDFGQVKLGKTLLPGAFAGMDIQGQVRVDDLTIAGQSGSSKQPLGFEDAKISLEIRLLTDEESTCYDKAEQIVQIFQAVDSAAKPFIYRIVNKHTALWKIKEVVFEGLRTKETNQDDTLIASLEFTEYRPVLVAKEKRTQVQQTPAGTNKDAFAKANPTTPSQTTVKTPAVDDDKVAR